MKMTTFKVMIEPMSNSRL